VSGAFGRLHPSVRYLVQEVLRFPGLRPVQEATIGPVLEGLDCVVLAPTAGGKTEAAAFPVLSRVLSERMGPVSVLYVCPLRALLNNQEPRLKRMTEAVGLRAGKWHGDVPAGERKALLAEPPDVLLITPESLEVLLISPSRGADALLPRVRIAVIDEVHAFANDPRGAHLVSVLERLQARSSEHIQRLGLSATVGNPDALARWLQGSGATRPPTVVNPAGPRRNPMFRFEVARDPLAAAQHIRDLGRGEKRLVFVESRSRAEQLASALQQVGVRAWVHHSSVGRARRQDAEEAFEGVRDAALVATSSMELGIDVGDLDHVFQLDAPATVSSLAQRLGRTGRRPGTVPRLTFVAGAPEDLLLAMALAGLYDDGFIEDVDPSIRNWPVLVHQILANLLETSGCSRGQLVERVRWAPSFAGFRDEELHGLLDHLLAEGWLEEADGALVLGRRAEQRFGRRNFFRLYAVFDTPPLLTVLHGTEEVGTLQSWFAAQLTSQRNTFRLGGRAWEAKEVDLRRAVVRAVPAPRGKVPSWTGKPTAFGRPVCERILALLKTVDVPEGASEEAAGWLAHARAVMAEVPATEHARPLVREKERWVWHTFAGSRVNAVLGRLVEHATAWPTSSSNLSLKLRTTSEAAPEVVVRVHESLVEDELPPEDEWAEFETEGRAPARSAFEECLPEEALQASMRAAVLDLGGARRWASAVEVTP